MDSHTGGAGQKQSTTNSRKTAKNPSSAKNSSAASRAVRAHSRRRRLPRDGCVTGLAGERGVSRRCTTDGDGAAAVTDGGRLRGAGDAGRLRCGGDHAGLAGDCTAGAGCVIGGDAAGETATGGGGGGGGVAAGWCLRLGMRRSGDGERDGRSVSNDCDAGGAATGAAGGSTGGGGGSGGVRRLLGTQNGISAATSGS